MLGEDGMQFAIGADVVFESIGFGMGNSWWAVPFTVRSFLVASGVFNWSLD